MGVMKKGVVFLIDIHSHIVFGVDDGAASLEESIAIIEGEIKAGVKTVVCTPHYRHGMFETSNEEIERNFKILCDEVKKRNLPIKLYLGREIFYRTGTLNEVIEKNLHGYLGKKTLLLEFSYTHDPEIDEVVYSFKCHGYDVVVAHIERYEYIKNIEQLLSIKSFGAKIQVNAETIVGARGVFEKRRILKYIKLGLVDYIASDIHFSRKNYMEKAYEIINKKFGPDVANDLFNNNALELISEDERKKAI